jgi:sulfur-oxidizing protein SoxY
MKFKFEDDVKFNEPNLVQLMVRHPNESALAGDFDPNLVPQFVRSVVVTYAGKPVMTAEVDFSLSDNPSFRFYFVPRDNGELRSEVEDTHDNRFVQALQIQEGAPVVADSGTVR